MRPPILHLASAVFVAAIALLLLVAPLLGAEPGSGQPGHDCYRPGEHIASDVYIYDAEGQRVRLLDLVTSETRVIYLVLLGGPSLQEQRGDGGFWCGDTFNDLPISTYLIHKYRGQEVLFIPVICPPVYHEEYYGIPEGTFGSKPDSDGDYQHYFRRYVEATNALQRDETIPFDKVYYDPHFALMFNFRKGKPEAAFAGEPPAWLGKFKPCEDTQTYSTPTIWLLSAQGEVLGQPFAGNRYTSRNPTIAYTVRDVEQALIKALKAKQ